jgi:hypothetical protein
MPLNVGDAVLTFLGNTEQLDQVFARIPGEADASMSAAATSVNKIGTAAQEVSFELDATGENAAFAGGMIKSSMDSGAASTSKLKTGLAEVAGEEGLVAEASAELGGKLASMFGLIAAAEGFKFLIEGTQKSVLNLELLSEKTGIGITQLAGIEHVAEASGVKFDSVSGALTRLSKAQALAIEGGEKQIKAFSDIGISVDELKSLSPEDLFFRVGEAMANSESHAAANAAAFTILGRGGSALIPIFEQNKDKLHEMVEEAGRASGVTKEAGASALDWAKQEAILAESMRSLLIPAMQAAVPVIKFLETMGTDVAMVLRDLGAAVGGLFLVVVDDAKGMGTLISDIVHGNFSKMATDAKEISAQVGADFGGIGIQFSQNWKDSTEHVKKIWEDVKPLKPAEEDLSGLFDEKAADKAKKNAEKLFFEIAKAKAEAGKIVDKGADSVSKQMGAQLDAQLKSELATAKATEDLAKADEKLKDAQDKLALETVTQGFRNQEDAIRRLAAEGIITEQQKAAKLISIYNQEEAAALRILQDRTNREKTIIENAQKEIEKATAAKTKNGTPLFSDAQILELRKNLALAQTEYTKTEQEITRVQDHFDQQRIALQRGAIGQAIALATAAGNQQLATELKQHQAALLAIKDEIELAKARHQSTAALKEAEKALQADTNVLVKQTHQIGLLRHAWDLFAGDFRKKAKEEETNAQAMATSFTIASQSMQEGIQDAFSAMVTGSESAGQAVERAAAKAVAGVAQHWGALFMARAGADLFDNPPKAAAEFSAGVALLALAGALGGLGGSSVGGKGGGGNNANIDASKVENKPVQSPGSGINVPHLGAGGLVTAPMLAMIGEGRGREAVIPLDDPRAMQAVQRMFGGSGGGTQNHYYLDGFRFSASDMSKLTRQLTRAAQTGRARVTVATASRVTRRG